MDENADFQDAWARASAVHDASAALKDLVSHVCSEIVRQPTHPAALRSALEALLAFLASSSGRNKQNCEAVDSFFCWPEIYGWKGDWRHLPEAFQEVLEDIGGALHDTISAPETARNFDSTPEQLLDRVRKINVSSRAV